MARYGLAPSGRPQQRRAAAPQQQSYGQPAYGDQQGYAPSSLCPAAGLCASGLWTSSPYSQPGYADQAEPAFDLPCRRAQPMGAHAQQAPQQPARPSYIEPLPYVPENKSTARSITANTQPSTARTSTRTAAAMRGYVPGTDGHTAYGQRNSQPFAQQQAGFGGAAGAPGAPAPRNVPNPQLFNDDAAQPVPCSRCRRAWSTPRPAAPYALTKNRMIAGP